MSRLYDIYQRLRAIDDVSVDQAMAAALPTADPLAIKLIALNLLERRRPEGAAALVLHYDRLPPDIQATVVRHASELYRPLREVTSRKGAHGPANAIRIIVASKAVRLAYLVTEQLHDSSSGLRSQAAEALLELARWARTTSRRAPGGDGPRYDSQSVQYLQAAIEQAVVSYPTHKQSDVLLALMTLLPRAMPASMHRMADSRDPCVEGMRQLLGCVDQRDVRRAMLVVIQVPTLAQAVMSALSAIWFNGQLADVLSNSHLLLSRSVVEPLQRLAGPQWLWPTDEDLARWLPHQTRGLARWAVALGLSSPQRVENLAALCQLADPLSRLAALRELIHESSQSSTEGVNDAICRFCDDPEASLARIALRHLLRCQWEGLPRLLPSLINSGHPDVGRLAREHLAPIGFDRLWLGWPRMSPAQRLAVGRALMKIDPAFHQHVGHKLADPKCPIKLRAMSIIHCLNQGHLFETALLVLADDPDKKIASAAMRALGTAHTQNAVETLESALDHSDSRVRANAVEALQQLRSTRHVRKLVEMAHHEHHRPRANAIQALMQMSTGDAVPALLDMLHDSRPAQRTGALWVVESMGLVEVARQIAEMSITDVDGKVKARAARVIRGLMDLMNQGPALGHRLPKPA